MTGDGGGGWWVVSLVEQRSLWSDVRLAEEASCFVLFCFTVHCHCAVPGDVQGLLWALLKQFCSVLGIEPGSITQGKLFTL